VSPGVLVSAHVIKNKPATTISFEKVKSDIEKLLHRKKQKN
jgi:hypothetical protein